MTDSRRALLDELTTIQNHETHWNRDLMTITGFMSDEEVRAHIERWRPATFNVGDRVAVVNRQQRVLGTGTILRITQQTSDGTPLYWISGRKVAVTANALRKEA